MKERGIIFDQRQVRNVLDGNMTQVRRVIKPMLGRQSQWLTQAKINNVPNGYLTPDAECGFGWQMYHPYAGKVHMGVEVAHDSPYGWIRCPFGKIGDELFVKETWKSGGVYLDNGTVHIEYKAGGRTFTNREDCGKYILFAGEDDWHPSGHMLQWMSRIRLRIKDIRIERVQHITYDNAIAEGIEKEWDGTAHWFKDYTDGAISMFKQDPISSFRSLWDSINAKRGYGWETNCWLWVIEFERIDG